MSHENNKRIAKNTMMLYFRQILILLVSLYTVRVVLNALGVEDYGIYSVVGGIVSFFTFLSGTMASATQRFFSFALGQNNQLKLNRTFSVNLLIYTGIAVIAFILLESVGLWFVKQKLQVPIERMDAALLIYHFSVFTFIATIFTTPFMAIIIAHEDMQIYAYVSIVEAIMKLAVVFLLIYLPGDKLELYGILLFAVAIANTAMYLAICLRKYSECQFRTFYWDKTVLVEIIGFTGWTLFGQLTTVFRNQAVTILLNQFFTPVIVAARAIAVNVANHINVFSSNFNVGLYPPIIKAYATHDQGNMFSLIFNGSKITFFLMWIFSLPFFLEMDAILTLWLKNPPAYSVLFARLALVEVLINSLSLPITTAARAPGKMKIYELSLGTIQIAIFIASWIVLKLGGAPYTVFVIAIVANLLMFGVRLIIVSKLIELPVRLFLQKVASPVSLMVLVSSVPAFAIHLAMPKGLLYSGFTIITSISLSVIAMYYLGLDQIWREKIVSMIKTKILQLIKRKK